MSRLWARLPGSPPLPPSPMPMYRYPSGPNAIIPPLWLAYGWAIVMIRPAGAGLPPVRVRRGRRYSVITVSPFVVVKFT